MISLVWADKRQSVLLTARTISTECRAESGSLAHGFSGDALVIEIHTIRHEVVINWFLTALTICLHLKYPGTLEQAVTFCRIGNMPSRAVMVSRNTERVVAQNSIPSLQLAQGNAPDNKQRMPHSSRCSSSLVGRHSSQNQHSGDPRPSALSPHNPKVKMREVLQRPCLFEKHHSLSSMIKSYPLVKSESYRVHGRSARVLRFSFPESFPHRSDMACCPTLIRAGIGDPSFDNMVSDGGLRHRLHHVT